MSSKCPGSDGRDVVAVEVACPRCGEAVELFSDEQRRKCPACGERVQRSATPACAAWCPSAITCLGVERYLELKDSGAFDASEDSSS